MMQTAKNAFWTVAEQEIASVDFACAALGSMVLAVKINSNYHAQPTATIEGSAILFHWFASATKDSPELLARILRLKQK